MNDHNERKISAGELIFSEIDNDQYLKDLYDGLLCNYALYTLGSPERQEVNYIDALRFADLLSKSTHATDKERHRLWAQEIAILCSTLYPNDPKVQVYVSSIFTTIGNYAALSQLPNTSYLGILDEAFNHYQSEYLKVPGRDDIRFLAPQKRAYDQFSKEAFSFSAPTSLGKSFLMKTFITNQVRKGVEQNYVILVPTKALINETRSELIHTLGEDLEKRNYCIVTAATDIMLEGKHNFIFVLTAERLLYLLIAKPSLPIHYLFVDEAHKLSAIEGRTTFYYQVISILNNRIDKPHFIFASPNIPNPEVFLKTLTEDVEHAAALHTDYAPVTQFKFIIDLETREISYYNPQQEKQQLIAAISKSQLTLNSIINALTADHQTGLQRQTLVYHNSKQKAVEAAQSYAKLLAPIEDEELIAVSQRVREEIHDDYYLADLLCKGVAYHIGYLPPAIREQIEELFRKKKITTMFCTSTLLEGVNLPADNLIFTSNKNGRKNLRPIDFKNLLGRVGRISYNLYGNVFFLVPAHEKRKPDYEKMLSAPVNEQNLAINTSGEGFREADKKQVVEALLNGQTHAEKENKNLAAKQMIRKFTLILLRDLKEDRKSVVRREFNLTREEEEQVLQAFSDRKTEQDDDINITLDQAENIKTALKEEGLSYPEPNAEGKFSYEETLDFLTQLAEKFKWDEYESEDLGKKDRNGEYSLLRWYTVVLLQWIEGHGLNYIMTLALRYKSEGRTLWMPGKGEVQYLGTLEHKNIVMNDILAVIESIILFKLSNYFLRFSNEKKELEGKETLPNDWYEYVEYGTTNRETIMLQRFGFTRETATLIKKSNIPSPTIIFEDKTYLSKQLLEAEDERIAKEAREIYLNIPKAFKAF